MTICSLHVKTSHDGARVNVMFLKELWFKLVDNVFFYSFTILLRKNITMNQKKKLAASNINELLFDAGYLLYLSQYSKVI